MSINLSTNFNMNTNLPIDTRLQVATIADRDSIPVGSRYLGMKVFVLETNQEYQLKEDNNTWDIIYDTNGEYITSDKIASGAVSSGKLSSQAVNSGKIATNAVTTEKIADNAVTSDKIADESITASKLSSDVSALLDTKGLNIGYIWWANQDVVSTIDDPFVSKGAISSFKNVGNAFTVMAASSVSSAGKITADLNATTVTPKTKVGDYDLYNNGDLVIYAGSYGLVFGLINVDIWKRIPMHEAKSGLDGLMSGGDKDNVTYLYNRYIKGAIYNSDTSSYNGQYSNDCKDTGLYTNVDSGRPSGVDDTDTKELFSVLTMTNPNDSSKTPQLTLSQKRNKAWIRNNSYASWERLLTQTDHNDLYTEMTSHVEDNVMINWFNKPGFHFARLADGNAANPIQDDIDRRYIIHVGKEKNGDSETGNSFQLLEHVITGRVFYRSGPVTLGNSTTNGGSFGSYSWTEIEKEKEIPNIGDILVKDTTDAVIEVKVTSNIHKIFVQTVNCQPNILIPTTFPIGWACEIDFSKCTSKTVFFSNIDDTGSYEVNDGNLDPNRNYLNVHEEDGWKIYDLGLNRDIVCVSNNYTQYLINIDNYTKEIVFNSDIIDNEVLIPTNLWVGWRCILNFKNVTTINHFDVGYDDGSMFGVDSEKFSNGFSPGKVYMLIKINESISPSGYEIYEVDNITRLPITS